MSFSQINSAFLLPMLLLGGFFALPFFGELSTGNRETEKKMLKMYR